MKRLNLTFFLYFILIFLSNLIYSSNTKCLNIKLYIYIKRVINYIPLQNQRKINNESFI
jgi:hypothetical protein